MSNVEKFEELLRSDEALQEKMRAATAAFEGDKADEAAVFDAVVAPLAAEASLPFTLAEARARALDGAHIADDELDALAAGKRDRYGKAEAACLIVGVGLTADACATAASGVGACAYFGVGIIGF